jgi:hypothetical protein
MKKMNGPEGAKDDRPEASISFAASNLVKPGLRSRARQKSEPPPPNRDMFPPTPPPDADRNSAASSGNAAPTMTRADSVRAGPRPRPLDLTVAGFEKPRSELNRTMSERSPRIPMRSRTQSEKSGARNSPGLMRMQSERRPSYASSRGDMRSPRGYIDDQYDDVYDMYGRQSMARSQRGGVRTTNLISEEDEEEYAGGYDEPEFDMMPRGSRGLRPQQQQRTVEVRKIRVKVHSDDTRYVMVGTAIEFGDFIDQIRTKFGIRQSFKVKMKDEGDMITMADQDDLEMALMASVSDAKRERSEMGKMEVSAYAHPPPLHRQRY